MANDERRTEILVGAFVGLGLLLLATLILLFGNVKDLFRETYRIGVTFESARGLSDRSFVTLGGAKVGKVDGKPRLNASFDAVVVDLAIYEEFNIPVGSSFGVSTAGLMGDAYVAIEPPDDPSGNMHPKDGSAEVQGDAAGGLDGIAESATDVARRAGEVLTDVRGAVQKLNTTLDKINEGLLADANQDHLQNALVKLDSALTKLDEGFLSEENSAALKDALAGLKDASSKISEASDGLGPVLEKGHETLETAEGTFEKFGQAADTLTGTAGDMGAAAREITGGEGLATALVADAQLRAEFAALVANLRRHGILFYRDTSDRHAPGGESGSRPAGTEDDPSPARRSFGSPARR